MEEIMVFVFNLYNSLKMDDEILRVLISGRNKGKSIFTIWCLLPQVYRSDRIAHNGLDARPEMEE